MERKKKVCEGPVDGNYRRIDQTGRRIKVPLGDPKLWRRFLLTKIIYHRSLVTMLYPSSLRS